ncbi:nuclear receptor coactivator 5-like isoform X2 [Hemicordylus capensis]|uniref:nuclear receptor coactivator 5-like isoform X2 n=1 Tax=Hemicordylus capensis TaxID=884348 RepID=UPI002302B324|nr:nuclear receptor coactivator 5-like isoform X2 [Hemicordylus capensis]
MRRALLGAPRTKIKMSSWIKVTTDQAQTPVAEQRHRAGWIPRLLDINPYKPFQKSSYSPPDGYPKDYEDANSFEELFGQQYHPSSGTEDNFERYQYSQKDDDYTKDVHRDKLYMQFYQQIEREYDRDRPSDCVIVSISKDQAEYSTAIGHRLQDHGLVVEMIYLTSESGLTRALQEVKNDGSPFCVLVEPSNVALSSCTVIMLHQSIKIHRNMPMEDALALIAKEFKNIFGGREQQERTEISHKAADLADDYLERAVYESYHVPLGIRHLLFLLSEGKHLYLEELNSISDYLKTRRNKLEGFVAETEALAAVVKEAMYPASSRPSTSALPQTLSKPPPLLPTPGRNPALGPSAVPSAKPALLGERPLGALLPTPGAAGPKGKPPPLLTKSMKRPIILSPSPHLPSKRPLLAGRPGLLPTPAAQGRSVQHHWVPKPKFLA